MYVSTFYSFKGGVGRTLALVNVGLALAQAGRKVLLVDFDLEAPGIDTFDPLKPQRAHPGVVEYVSDYVSTGSSPDVREYVWEPEGLGRDSGRLWIMGAGKGDAAYQSKLAAINWQALYSDLDGFLMFEDLKEQWKQAFQPDYVLIDSRTGHTDICGICTRQLPDAVVMLFFPNEQNLQGLKRVVSDIREEANGPRQKSVQLYFVMSNVPDLDDEDDILKKRSRAFKEALGYTSVTTTIHHYDSLALLNQVIFVRDRPRSRLSKEYRRLKDEIVANNVEDREGAIGFLHTLAIRRNHALSETVSRTVPALRRRLLSRSFPANMKPDEIEKRVDTIRERFSEDGEILFLIATLKEQEGKPEEAIALLDKAIEEFGYRNGGSLLARAVFRQQHGDREGAITDAKEALGFSNLDIFEVKRALTTLRQIDERSLRDVSSTRAIESLDPDSRLRLLSELNWNKAGQEAAVTILSGVLKEAQPSSKLERNVRNELMLCLIGLSMFSEAMETLNATRPEPWTLDIQDAFNYAMAEWGETGKVPIDLLRRVIEVDREESPSPNIPQCLAVAYWALGDQQLAAQQIKKAEERMEQARQPEFSCWRYRMTTYQTFVADCKAIRSMIAGEMIRPEFFKKP